MKNKKLPSQITISCGRDEDGGRLVLAAAEGEGTKLRKFSLLAYTGTKMSLPGIPYPVVVDLSGLRVSSKARPILRDHNPSQIVGHTDNVTVTSGVLKVEGSVSGANAHAAEIVASADNGFPWQASIGASVQKMVFVEDGERVQVNGRSYKQHGVPAERVHAGRPVPEHRGGPAFLGIRPRVLALGARWRNVVRA
jgi:hypothetical protein